MVTIQTVVIGELSTNCYIISDPSSHEAVVVDPADEPEYISDILLREKHTLQAIIATHGHFDHILGAFGLQTAWNVPCLIHPDDSFLVDRMMNSAQHFLHRRSDPPPNISALGETLMVGNESIRVLHVPGHTPGSVALYVPCMSSMVVGDVFFSDGAVGRTDTAYGDPKKLAQSIRCILETDAITYYPGHGESLSKDRAKILFGV